MRPDGFVAPVQWCISNKLDYADEKGGNMA